MNPETSSAIGLVAIVALAVVGTIVMTSLPECMAERATAGDLPHRDVVEPTGVGNLTRLSTAVATTFVYTPRGDEDAVSFVPHGYYIDGDCAPLYVARPREPVAYVVPVDFDLYARRGLEKLPSVDLTVVRDGVPATARADCRSREQVDEYYDILGDLRRSIETPK